MILSFDDLKQYRHKVAMVDGAFDPLHGGHIEYFRQAAGLGLPVLCNIASDAYVNGKHPVLLSAAQRAAVIDAIKHVELTHPNPFDTEAVLRELRPKYYLKGSDWAGRLPPEQIGICAEHDIEIVYLDTVQESSTRILEDYLPQEDLPAQAAAFEDFVRCQEAVPAAHYDEEYFTAGWREAGNRYTLEARRKIEGRNPQLIKEVFRPERVLDMGCGPGALMYLLHELGVDADGVDFSETSKCLAPAEVRERIVVASVADEIVPEASYDLVVCREVFEHLTVRQIERAVRNVCRISSRFVYATTRFHPCPSNLLDVTDERHVDPTHITLLTKELLRLLFVLQGYIRRPDLEARMDWLNKGRVLVYEGPSI